MASNPFIEILFVPGSSEQTIVLGNSGVSPFDSGIWSFFHIRAGVQLTTGVQWSNIDSNLACRVGKLELTVNPVGQGIPTSFIAKLEWSLLSGSVSPPSPSPTKSEVAAQKFAEKHTGLLGSPHVNNVRFVFPRDGGRELWSNAGILSDASPYFKTLLESGFSDGQSSITHSSSGATERSALDFDDSDDDETLATPPSDAPTSDHSCTFPHHKIEITQSTYTTYKAVLCWIYTNHISWAPLASSFTGTSTARRSNAVRKATQQRPKLPTPASPKSVYRLAHLLEIPALQRLALDELKSQLTVANAAAELFSQTSGRYDDVLKVVLAYVKENKGEVMKSSAWTKILEQVEELPWGGKVAMKLAMDTV
ncbi:hypothetical protein RQP46_002935 [Phenoliferia psychrophenolica]